MFCELKNNLACAQMTAQKCDQNTLTALALKLTQTVSPR